MQELEKIENILYQAKYGNAVNFVLSGERGIGKSSLLIFTNYLAKGELNHDEVRFHYLTIQVNLDKNTNLFQLAKKIKSEISRSLQENDPVKKACNNCWKYVKQIEIQGIKYNERTIDNDELMDEIIYSLIDTAKEAVKNGYDGILILLDEADNAENAELGTFLKNLSEKLVVENCQRVIFGLAGLPKIKTNLFKDHPSSLRIFDIIELSTLTDKDVYSIVDSAIKKARDQNKMEFTITETAKHYIFKFSEGYPHFVQQIGASSFDFLPMGKTEIDEKLVDKTFYDKENGALKKIGLRYYYDLYWNKIKEEKYREVLRIMASIGYNKWVKKKDITKSFSGGVKTLSNALSALTDKDIIIKDDTTRGSYRLQWIGFAVWIKYFGIKK